MSAQEIGHSWRITIEDLKIDAHIGINPDELHSSQEIGVDITVDIRPGSPSGPAPFVPESSEETDEKTVCYDAIARTIVKLAAGKHWRLAEELAQQIAEACFADGRITRAQVRVRKPAAIPRAAWAGVECLAVRSEY